MYGYNPAIDAWFMAYAGTPPVLPGVIWLEGRSAPLYDKKPRAAFIIDPHEVVHRYVSCLYEIWTWQGKKYPHNLMKGPIKFTPEQVAYAKANGFVLPKGTQ